jgi:hypothetical protein
MSITCTSIALVLESLSRTTLVLVLLPAYCTFYYRRPYVGDECADTELAGHLGFRVQGLGKELVGHFLGLGSFLSFSKLVGSLRKVPEVPEASGTFFEALQKLPEASQKVPRRFPEGS